jgi:hypothetical protein
VDVQKIDIDVRAKPRTKPLDRSRQLLYLLQKVARLSGREEAMGEKNSRRLVGYRVRLDVGDRRFRYSAPDSSTGSTDDVAEARVFSARSEAYTDIEQSNARWQNDAKVVAVYRRTTSIVRRTVLR